MDAGMGDAIIGTTEDGRPIYRSQLGTQYWQAPRAPKPKPDVASLLPAYGGQYETSKTAPAWAGSQPGLGDLGWALGGVLGAVMSGVSAPGRALRGQPVTKGDVINTALDWGMMTAPMSAPRGALRAGGIRAYHGGMGDPAKAATGRGAWYSEARNLAEEYASGGGSVKSAEIFPKRPIEFVHAEQNRTIGDLISTALEGAGEITEGVGSRVSPVIDRLRARYGSGSRPLFEYWHNDPDIAELFRGLGYDSISVAEKSGGPKTWGVLDPGVVKPTGIRAYHGSPTGYKGREIAVFDDKLITILRKYGLLPALLGGSGIFNQQQPQG